MLQYGMNRSEIISTYKIPCSSYLQNCQHELYTLHVNTHTSVSVIEQNCRNSEIYALKKNI